MWVHILPVFYALSLVLLTFNPVDCKGDETIPLIERETHPLFVKPAHPSSSTSPKKLTKGIYPPFKEAVMVIEHSDSNPTSKFIQSNGENDENTFQSASWYLVPQNLMKPWVTSMISNPYDGFLAKQDSYFILNRRRRQPGGDPTGTGGGGTPTAQEIKLTPVLEPINGSKSYDETDCMSLEQVAVILRSSFKPRHKREMIEAKTCLLPNGLECVPIEDRAGSGVFRKRCRCMSAFGNKPVVLDRAHRGKVCYIPAGKGWVSECHNKTWTEYGYPLPYGDPPGANAEQAAQEDAINRPDGSQEPIPYIKWNTIKPKCVPNAECREKGTYIGQRCQCKKGHELIHKEGTCSDAHRFHQKFFGTNLILMSMMMITLNNY
ncbi:unnamed protein product [Orchesella dallaii]|uniref:DUF4789 domain-containing protein n=1 Tax=Orchesella dallaii TaxID=48710 RepID=A0ABP1R0X0_9HEXA